MKQFKTGNALTAEYIAVGANGKHVILHMYSGDIVVQRFPALIPLAFYIEIVPEADIPKSLQIEILQNKKSKARIETEFQFEPDKLGVLVIPQMGFTIDKKTEIRVVASGEGYKPTVLLKKSINVGEISGAPVRGPALAVGASSMRAP